MEESKQLPFRSDSIPKVLEMFGSSFELDAKIIARLKKSCGLSTKAFDTLFKKFKDMYQSQKVFAHNDRERNILFCDFLLFARKNGFDLSDYFGLELYDKPLAEQKTFVSEAYGTDMHVVFNDRSGFKYLDSKPTANRIFAEHVRRDWLDTTACTLEDFKHFVRKHARFFAKPVSDYGGHGASVVSVDENFNADAAFKTYRRQKIFVEEVIDQHASLAEFCPDTINTIRIITLLDPHGAVHITTASGRFGRVGSNVDNYTGGGSTVIIDPITGEIISDAINKFHERVSTHPDTGKKFRGFRYPYWAKVRAAVIKMAKLIPSLKLIGWDISITSKDEIELVEANNWPGPRVQQAADSIGRLHLYKPLVEEWKRYNREHLQTIGYRINDIDNFGASYQTPPTKRETRAEFALKHLIEGCQSVLDVGCRETKFAKKFCPSSVEYHALDYIKYDDETIECDFRTGIFPELEVDTCLEVVTAEYVELLPEFLENLCNAARRQVLMVCRPIDRETVPKYRWSKPYVTDFTEKFLIESIEKKGFYLHQMKTLPDNKAVILYDFRRR